MEHEEIIALMMDALDDQIGEPDQRQLQAHLTGCASCNREWRAIQVIHQLLGQAPALSPAPDFAERTLARLPSARHRLWALGAAYVTLLFVGFLPLALVTWLAIQFGSALNQPALLRGLLQAADQLLDLGGVVVSAGLQGLSNMGDLVGQQPALAGWLLVMVGIIFLWGGVYNQLTAPRRVV